MFAPLIPLVSLVLTSCGGHPTPGDAAATVDGQTITHVDVRAYVDYALSFYAWADGADPAASNPGCTPASRDAGCLRVQNQALRRLIEEDVIEQYAAGHGIALSASDRRAVSRNTEQLLSLDTTAKQLLAEHKITRAFVLVLLTRETLVRKVEAEVGRNQPGSGPALDVREFEIPRRAGVDDAGTYHQAVDLATDGRPVPPGTMVRTSWVARFHLAPGLVEALASVSRGQFVGPFTHAGYYLDVQLLGRGIHRYGKPARLALQADYFRRWLDSRVSTARPQCFDLREHGMPCPSPQD
jgi:hypothetical protein